MKTNQALVGLVVCLVSACNSDRREASQVERSGATMEFKTETLFSVGSAMGEDAFGRVVDLSIGSDGLVYVLDEIAAEVVVLRQDGSRSHTIGAKGVGPGEFQLPRGLFWMPDGSLGVWDPRARRVQFLSPDGSYVGTATRLRGHNTVDLPYLGRTDGTGALHEETWELPRRVERNEYGEVIFRSGVRSYQLSATTGQVVSNDDFRTTPAPNARLFERMTLRNRESGEELKVNVPGSPRLQLALGPEGEAWVGWTDSYDIWRVDSEGSIDVRIERSVEGRRVDQDVVDRALSRWDASDFEVVDPKLSAWPEYLPSWSGLQVDNRGRVWVADGDALAGRNEGGRVRVFSEDGHPLMTGELPFRISAGNSSIRDNLIAARVRDPALGHDRVVLLKILDGGPLQR